MADVDTSAEEVERICARERHRPFPYSVHGLESATLIDALAADRDALRTQIDALWAMMEAGL